jgi:hypothetical protein
MSCDNGDENNSQAVQDYENSITAIINSGSGPLSVQGDAGSVTQRSAQDLIAISNYLAGIAAAQTRNKGVRFTRMIPDGTVQGPRQSFRSPWLGWPSWNGYSWP